VCTGRVDSTELNILPRRRLTSNGVSGTKISDGLFLVHGTGRVNDILLTKVVDLIDDSDYDPTTLMTAIDHGPHVAVVSIVASKCCRPKMLHTQKSSSEYPSYRKKG